MGGQFPKLIRKKTWGRDQKATFTDNFSVLKNADIISRCVRDAIYTRAQTITECAIKLDSC